jgi:hypothetical protein
MAEISCSLDNPDDCLACGSWYRWLSLLRDITWLEKIWIMKNLSFFLIYNLIKTNYKYETLEKI